MALSFEESKKQLMQQAATPMTLSMRAAAEPAAEPIAAYSGDENWEKPVNASFYQYYDGEYSDTDVSMVDGEKNIILSKMQINLTQENNSQYIPFEIPRYYDGFDLASTELSVYWVNKNGEGSFSVPVDVYCSTDKIRFAWLVDENVTSIAGKVKFEIQASGTNSQGLEYLWKTLPNDGINVLQSLYFNTFVKPDESWQTGFVAKIAAEKEAAQAASAQAAEALDQVQILKQETNEIKAAAQQLYDNLYNGLEEEAAKAVETVIQEYAKTTYVDEADAAVEAKIPTNLSQLNNDAGLTTQSYVTEYVSAQISQIDVREQLKDYALKEEIPTQVSELENDAGYLTEHQSLEGYATETYVQEEVKKVDVSEQLAEYAKSADVYTKTEVDAAISNVEVDLSDYYTKTEVDTKTGAIASAAETASSGVSSLSKTVSDLQKTVSEMDTSARVTYDVKYNDTEDADVGENVFAFYEITNEGQENEEREIKQKFTIVGGGGGSATSSTLKIGYVTTSPYVVTIDDKAVIKYTFSGTDSSGDDVTEGNATWKVAGRTVATNIAIAGENEFDITDFITVGTQKVNLTITDDAGSLVSKNWTVQKIDVRLESNFNDKITYPLERVVFDYTPYGAISKTVHFKMDGTEIGTVTTTSSGIPTAYEIPAQAHGAHLLEVYMTATVNGNNIESNRIVKDIIWYDPASTLPVIGTIYQEFTARQYDATNIEYTVYDPSTEKPQVEIAVDGTVVSTPTLEQATNIYTFKTDVVGPHTITIKCGETVKTLKATITELDIKIEPVMAGLVFDFNPSGRSNNDTDRIWSTDTVAMTVSDNFDWVNGGYQYDENGDQYFCVKAGTSAVINYNLFADDPKKTGKEFKVIFRTKNIRKRDTSFLTCIDNNIGLDMKVENATVYNSGGSLKSDYCEDAIIEYEFNINKDTDMMIVMSYEDGAPSKPCEYTETSSFKQAAPKPITIGSEDCDILIYRMKAYSVSLTDTDIKNNFIADARNADEMLNRYYRNDIYNTDGSLISTSASGGFSVDALMKAAPDLRYIFLEVPQFTNDKDNKIDGCTVYFRYPAGTRPQDNWTCTGVRHRGQGTSSNLYGYSGRNIDLCMDRDESLFTWEDEEGNIVESSTVTLTDTSVPTDYLNIKVNIASSENANNAQFARRFNEYQPFLRYARKKDSRVKDTMEFYNCVVFIRETSTDMATTPHREFNDTNWHFYAIGNVGDSKKTDDTRVNNKRDPKEHVIEITDADKPLSAFPTGKDAHAICPVEEWCAGNTAYDILHSQEYVYDEEGKFESFGGETYEFRYEMKDLTDEQREVNINTWRDLYKFIVTSTDEEFYANLKNYFVVDSALYFYLFTERYTMVDNRAKNSFWHYGKVYISATEAAEMGETEASYYIVDDEAAAINDGYRYDLTFAYDMDTALGIDNTGDYVFSYGKEDTDYYVDGDPSSDYVFRVADSVFFCRLRDLFPVEMKAMFKDREEKNAWSSISLIDQWDKSQAQFPEELWRLDYQRKYYRTYLGLSIDNSIVPSGDDKGVDKSFLIGKFFGRKKYARRAFEINNEVYFATKYFGNKALSDVFWIRGNVPIGGNIKPNYSLTLVPYSDMYVCVQYTSTGTPIHKKVKAGETCYFENTSERMDFIYVYAASYIQEVGDLSRCYIGDNSFASATRLQKLVIGSTEAGYENTFMKAVHVESNPLLEYLDLRNVSGINTEIDVSSCGNLKELYAEGTNATGVIFANGGLLQTAHLPKITSLSVKNLHHIEDFVVDGYDNLQILIVENTPSINTYNIVANAPLLRQLRLIGINWDSTYLIEDASIFDRMLTIGGRDASNHETDVAVLTGTAHVAIMKELQQIDYKAAWPDLEITFNTRIDQFVVTFKNYDGTILETQYVDVNKYATDPVTSGRIPTPTKPSSVSTDFAYAGWDTDLSTTQIMRDRTVTATYSETTRTYTVKYVSMGITVQESSGLYGDYIPYTGATPTYTLEEVGNNFYLFNRWDKSGFIDCNKTINAVFDSFKYDDENFYKDKMISDLSNVQIYALSKLGADRTGMVFEDGDDYSIRVGYDVEFDDIDSEVIVEDKFTFDGANYIDTGLKLFDKDEDFTLAIDYEFLSGNPAYSVLAQCYKPNGSIGFRLWIDGSSQMKLAWCENSSAATPAAINNREMLVLRHKSGDNVIHVYMSNLDAISIVTEDLTTTKDTVVDSTLVLGCAKAGGNSYSNHAKGNVYWCKVWHKDLGDDICRKMAMWTRENIGLEVCGRNRFFVTGGSDEMTMVNFLATHLLERARKYNANRTNSGGWPASDLNEFLNTRLYEAMPTQIKALLKQVTIPYNDTESECYITIPAAVELSTSYSGDPYGKEMPQIGMPTISYMVSSADRRRAYDGADSASMYWTRSPLASSAQHIVVVEASGEVSSYAYSTAYAEKQNGVLIEISF